MIMMSGSWRSRLLFLAAIAHENAVALNMNMASNSLDRRAALSSGAAAIIAPAAAAAAVGDQRPVLVLGANGGTGRACVRELLARSIPCVAATRTGELSEELKASLLTAFPPSTLNNGGGSAYSLLRPAAVDVTSAASLEAAICGESAIKDCRGVIFAASASTKGGNARAVDDEGVAAAAAACIKGNIPRYVVVSSGAVTRPDSAVYKLLEFAGKGIMSAKISGEDKVRSLYATSPKGLGYTVVRPGGLTNEPPVGAAALELNQGDDKSGRLSREDVAALCVESLRSDAAFDATFECYNANTAKPVASVGISNLMKATDGTPYVSGRECRGDDWQSLLGGLARDSAIAKGAAAAAMAG
jgi:uncharacterized protein YbjT (DUF2867 family)